MEMWEDLEGRKDICRRRNTTRGKIDVKKKSKFRADGGVRQGCVLPPWLLDISGDTVVREELAGK